MTIQTKLVTETNFPQQVPQTSLTLAHLHVIFG